MSFEYGSFTEANGLCLQTSLSTSHKRVRMMPLSLHSCELFCTIKCKVLGYRTDPWRYSTMTLDESAIKSFKELIAILRAKIYAKKLKRKKCTGNNLNFIL